MRTSDVKINAIGILVKPFHRLIVTSYEYNIPNRP